MLNSSRFYVLLKLKIMSKGPITARINKISAAENFHILDVEQLCNEKRETVKLPQTADISRLCPGSVITYYRAEDGIIPENIHDMPEEERVVLVFSRNGDGIGIPPQEERMMWMDKGDRLVTLEKLPRIVEILLGLSSYYGKRRDIVEKSLEILEMSQDPETIDALFSVRPNVLDELFGEKFTVISVQIADSLLALAMAGADLEHPRRRDLRPILALAALHGETQSKIYDFMTAYERE